jgi:hypothetical protein
MRLFLTVEALALDPPSNTNPSSAVILEIRVGFFYLDGVFDFAAGVS